MSCGVLLTPADKRDPHHRESFADRRVLVTTRAPRPLMLSGHPVPTGKHHGHSRRTPLLISSGLHCQSDSQTHHLNELAERLLKNAEAFRCWGYQALQGRSASGLLLQESERLGGSGLKPIGAFRLTS